VPNVPTANPNSVRPNNSMAYANRTHRVSHGCVAPCCRYTAITVVFTHFTRSGLRNSMCSARWGGPGA
jgi:hypothetical protein